MLVLIDLGARHGFGEMALFRDEPRSATIEVGRRTRTFKPVQARVQTRACFQRLKQRYDKLLSSFAFKLVRTRVQSAWFRRLKLKYDKLLSSFSFNWKVWPCVTASEDLYLASVTKVGWCRLTVSKTVLKAPMVSVLETIMWMNCFQIWLSNSSCGATRRTRTCASLPAGWWRQGLTLVHFSAQREHSLLDTWGA